MSLLTKGKGSKGKGNGPYSPAHRVPWRSCLDVAEQRFLCAFAELHFLQYAYGLHQRNGTRQISPHDAHYQHAVMLLQAQLEAAVEAIECLRGLRIVQPPVESARARQTFLGWAEAHHIQLQGLLGCVADQAWRTFVQISEEDPEDLDSGLWV